VSGAKSQLIEDVEALKSSLSSVKFPYLPRRRDGENRLSREIDDILSLFTFLDEHKLLNMLPRYVADSPDAMPPIRLYEGELNGIISMIKRLGDRFDEYSLVLSTISRDLQLLQARCVAQVATCDQQQQQQSIERSSVGNNKTTEQPSAGNAPDWAVIASTPYVHANRFDLLRSTDDDEHSDAAAQADPYTTVQSRRGRRRARQLSSMNQATEQQQQQQQQQQVRQQQQPARPARARVLLGKSSNTDTKISAARQLRKKAVFCIDNVSTDCSTEDIKSFVSGLSIRVLTCFEVKPRRRRRDDDDINDRKAFRLCIYDEDRNRLLDDSIWPDSVSISQWFLSHNSLQSRINRQTRGATLIRTINARRFATRMNVGQPYSGTAVLVHKRLGSFTHRIVTDNPRLTVVKCCIKIIVI